MPSNGSFPPSVRFNVGDKVRIKLAAYRRWYEANVNGMWCAEEGETMVVMNPIDDTDLIDVRLDGGGWGAGIPARFLERLP